MTTEIETPETEGAADEIEELTSVQILEREVADAETVVAQVEAALNRAARNNTPLDDIARQLEVESTRLDGLKARLNRAQLLERLGEQRRAQAEEARSAHEALEASKRAVLAREAKQLRESAQEAAQAVREAITATRRAMDVLRLHSASVDGAAARIAELGLGLTDAEHDLTFTTGAEAVRGRSAVSVNGESFRSLSGRDLMSVLQYVNASVNFAEFHSREMPGRYVAGVDSAIAARLLAD